MSFALVDPFDLDLVHKTIGFVGSTDRQIHILNTTSSHPNSIEDGYNR